MKKQIIKYMLVLTFLLFSSLQASDKHQLVQNDNKYNKIVDNLLVGANSRNEGLKISSTYHLGEIKASKSLISLMRILHDDKNEEARISAALALIKIADARGIFAVKRAAIFDKSERVKRVCEKFYMEYAKTLKKS